LTDVLHWKGALELSSLCKKDKTRQRGRTWTTSVNFRLDLVRHGTKTSRIIRIRSVFSHGRVGKDINLATRAAAITGATSIQGRTRRVHKGTKTVRRFGRTGNVRHATKKQSMDTNNTPKNLQCETTGWTFCILHTRHENAALPTAVLVIVLTNHKE
jgi:hypothetical protein